MKNPPRMRTGSSTNGMSSAFEIHSTTSDVIELFNKPGSSDTKLVSTRFHKKYRQQMVKIQPPEKHILHAFNKQRKFNYFIPKVGINNNEIHENEETACVPADFCRRRMSAPELPPILNGDSRSGFINNRNLTSRSNTFHNNNLTSKSDPKGKKTIDSDSFVHAYTFSYFSQCQSTTATRKNGGRVSSAGTETRNYRRSQLSLHDFTKDLKIDIGGKISYTTMKNGVTVAATPRIATAAGEKSKYVLANPVRKMKHSYSESKIANGKSHVEKTIPRTKSDKSLTNYQANNGVHKTGKHNKVGNDTKQLTHPSESDNAMGHGDADNHCERATFYDSDSESDKDQRVLDWIYDVANAEPPEEPQIAYQDEPPQRDTAIRIVYNGDS